MSEEQKKTTSRTRKAATKVNKPKAQAGKPEDKPERQLIVHHHVRED